MLHSLNGALVEKGPRFGTPANNKPHVKAVGAIQRLQDRMFKWIHSSGLIYNTCWEDPRIDRALLQLNQDSQVVLITSAGCNALDDEWQQIFACSRPGSSVLMRSAGLNLSFLPRFVLQRVEFKPELSEPLDKTDRVGTYGSLHFASIK